MKLSDERTLGLDPRQRIIHQIESDINTGESRDLLKLLNKDGLQHRYPPNAFSQRCYSYIPGIEAFPELPVRSNIILFKIADILIFQNVFDFFVLLS